jgi:hypothetical protein
MRWIWALAIACVVAATGVRPQLEIRNEHASQFQRAPTTLQHLTARTPGSHHLATRPHRLGARDVPITIVAVIPQTALALQAPHARAFGTAWSLHTSPSSFVSAHPARGPPVG